MKLKALLYGCIFLIQISLAQSYKLKKWIVPDHYKIHFAGEIGFLSASVGKDFLDQDQLELDLFLGFLPKEIGGDDITTVALKTAYFPFQIKLDNTPLTLEPFGIGLNFYHSFGRNLNKYRDPDLYPPNYYWWIIGTRISPYISGRLGKTMNGEKLKSIQLYYEIGATDLYIFSWYENQESFPLYKIFNFSFGLSFKFH